MNALFGDATTAMPTPATQAERGSLMGYGSPASIDIRGNTYAPGAFGASDAIPGLDIDPPDLGGMSDGKPTTGERGRRRGESSASASEGVGGWISRMVSRTRRRKDSQGASGSYRQVEQDED